MAWLLFLDESGHDHKQMPYEVRGGIALQDSQLWPFTRAVQQQERECFGCSLHEFQKELKGSPLLDKKRFRFANQTERMLPAERQKHARSFLMKGFQNLNPTSSEFCAYGQACIEMARGIFQLLRDHQAVIFASIIPRGTGGALGPAEELLRKDKVFLLERYFYFLEREKQHGLLVMDGAEKTLDRQFVRPTRKLFHEIEHRPLPDAMDRSHTLFRFLGYGVPDSGGGSPHLLHQLGFSHTDPRHDRTGSRGDPIRIRRLDSATEISR